MKTMTRAKLAMIKCPVQCFQCRL